MSRQSLAMRSEVQRLAGTLLMACLLAACASAPVERAATDPDPLPLTPGSALATFDAVWQSIADTHFDAQFNGVDWNAVRVEFRPRAQAATTDGELREVLTSMVARLGQSHFEVVPTASPRGAGEDGAEDDGDVGLDLRIVDARVLVSQVREGGPAARAGIRPGWHLVRVGDLRLSPLVPEVVAPAMVRGSLDEGTLPVWFALRQRLSGRVGSRVSLVLEDGDASTVELDLVREGRAGTPVRFANLPPFYADLTWRAIEVPAGTVGYITFNIWMLPVSGPFDVAMDSLRSARGVVVDLRGNLGGLGELVRGVAGHFLGKPLSLGTFRTREVELEYLARPKRVDTAGHRIDPFGGPLAILIDEYTGSSSEIFAGGLQDLGRARVFGTRSAGAVLPARTTILPNGDTLLHATADFVTPSGRRLEGRGVIPDVTVEVSRDDYLQGRDPVLQTALDWIQEQAEKGS